MAKKSEAALTIIDKPNLQVVRKAVEAALAAVGKELGLAFSATGGHYSNGNTGDLKLEFVIAGKKAGKSAKDILGAEEWKKYAKVCGLDPKLLGTEFEYKGVTCKITGLDMRRRKYPVLVNMGGKEKLFPVETVQLYTDPKKLKAHLKLTANWQKPTRRLRGL